VRTHSHTHARTHMHARARLCAHARTDTPARTCRRAHTHTHTRKYIFVCLNILHITHAKTLAAPFFGERLALHTFLARAPCVAFETCYTPSFIKETLTHHKNCWQ
jgi:hypothetical protein